MSLMLTSSAEYEGLKIKYELLSELIKKNGYATASIQLKCLHHNVKVRRKICHRIITNFLYYFFSRIWSSLMCVLCKATQKLLSNNLIAKVNNEWKSFYFTIFKILLFGVNSKYTLVNLFSFYFNSSSWIPNNKETVHLSWMIYKIANCDFQKHHRIQIYIDQWLRKKKQTKLRCFFM